MRRRAAGDRGGVRPRRGRRGSGAQPRPLQRVSAWPRALPWALAGRGRRCACRARSLLWAPWRSAPAPAPRKLLAEHRRRRVAADGSRRVGHSVAGRDDARVRRAAGGSDAALRPELDQLQAAPLAGTEGAASPFFSPDGQWIAFFAGGKLKKVSVTGGAAVKLCDAPTGRGGDVDRRRHDHLHAVERGQHTLVRVSAAGGTPAVFGTLEQGAVDAAVAAGAPRRQGRALHRALVDGELRRRQPRRRAAVGRDAEDRRARGGHYGRVRCRAVT